jgi:hypothetical protein
MTLLRPDSRVTSGASDEEVNICPGVDAASGSGTLVAVLSNRLEKVPEGAERVSDKGAFRVCKNNKADGLENDA